MTTAQDLEMRTTRKLRRLPSIRTGGMPSWVIGWHRRAFFLKASVIVDIHLLTVPQIPPSKLLPGRWLSLRFVQT